MLQHADDTGATTFRVRVDWRQHGPDTLLTPDMAGFQNVPSRLFYNIAMFEENVWHAMPRLGHVSNALDVGKFGRHGLGFDSIVNITDLPSMRSARYSVGCLSLSCHGQ